MWLQAEGKFTENPNNKKSENKNRIGKGHKIFNRKKPIEEKIKIIKLFLQAHSFVLSFFIDF